ncbi:MAG: HslU--HslV peptidase ATPase subunit, partial [Nitrospinaceae bacterium]
LIKQYIALLKTEGVNLEFQEDSVLEIARMAAQVNQQNENIGARRLQTVLEKLLEDLSFDAPEKKGQAVSIDASYVQEKLADIIENEDLTRYIL